MKPRTCALLIALGGLGGTTFAADEVAPRSAGGQALVVPEEHLRLGEPYHVTPGEDTHFTCTSDATLQRVVATCHRVVGYVVTPFDVEEAETPIVAGAFRVPVASLRTGVRDFDELLRSPAMFNAAEFPEITCRLTRVWDAALVGEEKGRRDYTVKLAGELGVKDKTLSVELPARVSLVPFTWRTMRRNVGELLVLRGQCELKLADLGLAKPGPMFADRVADTFALDVCLFFSTMSPEKNLDPAIKTEHFLKQMRFVTLLRDFDDPNQAYEFGRALVRELWDDGPGLNRVAWAVLTEDGINRRDLAFAQRIAERANELTGEKDPTVLNTLARACFERGDVAAAVRWARRAVERLEGAAPDVAEKVRAALAQYEAWADKDTVK